mmetsp:Transcript_24402/g.96815  ORF Transcript_24402/g.96815 Transcript_24402/m.96815 type:complete len:238 (+) Transcript_24402:1229-1942(+)
MSPSAIWMPWISVASLALVAKPPPASCATRTVSARTSWISTEVTAASACSTTSSPVKGSVMGHDWRWSLPVTLKRGIEDSEADRTFSSDSGVMAKCLGSLGGGVAVGTSTMNSSSRSSGALKAPRLHSTAMVYVTLTYTPWYDSRSASPLTVGRSTNSNGYSEWPSGTRPGGMTSMPSSLRISFGLIWLCTVDSNSPTARCDAVSFTDPVTRIVMPLCCHPPRADTITTPATVSPGR